jgi:hypothetical protein
LTRYAIVRGHRSLREIEAYLPDNYAVLSELIARDDEFSCTAPDGVITRDERLIAVIEGRDASGWTLDGYVLPRLASGLIFGEEVGLDHPVFKSIPVAVH